MTPLTDFPLLEDPAALPGVRLQRRLGRLPGLWTTYAATRVADGEPVHATIVAAALQHAPGYAARFERDAEVAARVGHAALVPVLDGGRADRGLFLVTEVPPGVPLSEAMGTAGREATEVLALLAPVADALRALHAAGLVHGAVCPDTIVVGDDGRARLFGLGLVNERNAGVELGPDSGACVAPELLEGAAMAPSADVFGLAATCWRCLTGGFDRQPDGVSPAVLTALRRGLVDDPALRPATPAEFFDALLESVFGAGGGAPA